MGGVGKGEEKKKKSRQLTSPIRGKNPSDKRKKRAYEDSA